MNAEQFRDAAHAAVEDIIEYNRTIAERRIVPKVLPGYLKEQLPRTGPQEPQPWDAIQPDIEKLILPGVTHWQHPGFMAYYPADTSYPAMLGEMYSAAFNVPGFNWLTSPVSTELEVVIMDWLAQMINLPRCFMSESQGGGMITSTTSEATICAMIASRNKTVDRICMAEGIAYGTTAWEDRAFEVQSRLVVLASDQTHSCAQKGAFITGARFRSVPTRSADEYVLRPTNLHKALNECAKEGLIPFFLTMTIGTTSTCAIDPIAEIVDSLKEYPDVWVHVDAAYAGAALVCEEYHSLTDAFRNVNSFVFNMHKWLAVTFDASCVWFRNRQELIGSLSMTRIPPFLEYAAPESETKPVEYNDWQLVLGRRFRALKIWFVLRSYGVKALQEHVRKGIRLGGVLYNLMKSRADLFDIFSGPCFGLVTFSVKPRDRIDHSSRGQNHKAVNGTTNGVSKTLPRQSCTDEHDSRHQLTKTVLEKINALGTIFLTETTVDNKLLIRVSCGGQNTEESHILMAFRSIVEATESSRSGPESVFRNGIK